MWAALPVGHRPFDWKKTLVAIEGRPGHFNDAWGHWASDGFGLLEYLGWCEDLGMEPVLAVYAGYAVRQSRRPAMPRCCKRFLAVTRAYTRIYFFAPVG
jgi:hypothetical protein